MGNETKLDGSTSSEGDDGGVSMNEVLQPRHILLGHIQLLAQQLNDVRRKIDKAESIDEVLYDRVRAPLQDQIEEQRTELRGLRRTVETSDSFYPTWWDDLERIRGECASLFGGSLAFLEGIVARKEGWDNGLCQIADGLLHELAHAVYIGWDRLTIIADHEFIGATAEIIRIRFPEMSIWNLPVAAHEFGHYVAPKLALRDGSRPVEKLLDQEKEREERVNPQLGRKNWYYLHEYFADVFAVYSLGPAYVCTCLLLRFDPTQAYSESLDHPSYAARAHVMLRTLDQVRQVSEEPHFLEQVSFDLRESWQQNLSFCGARLALSETQGNELDKLADKLFAWLNGRSQARFSCDNWEQARSLSRLFHKQLESRYSGRIPVPEGVTIVEILNAAWHCRIGFRYQDTYDLQKIGRMAKEMCDDLNQT